MADQITKMTLSNGLEIRLKEIHTSPIISHWVWYRVGSRNEKPGQTGISHWVEHMQFKGTPRFPAGVLDKAISRDGGMWNAFTHLDWTTFFETVPLEKIDLALDLEADRMANSLYEPQEVESERTVIISEREGNENEPTMILDEAVQGAAFDTHPYHYEVIGLKDDLKRITRDELYQHYRSHYHPANAVLAMAGDFDTDDMLEKIRQRYEGVPAGPLSHLEIPIESPISSERRITVEGPGETTYLQVAYRAAAAGSQDFFVLSVLDSLLTGPTSLNMFGGGGISNKTSRLYKALVEKELSVSAAGGVQATIDPFLYTISATLHPDHSVDENLSAIDDEIHRLQDAPAPQSELERAIKQARALFAYGSENITNQAFWLGYAEMFDHYEWFERYLERLEAVTAAQVMHAAQSYLNSSHRVVGVYLPKDQHE